MDKQPTRNNENKKNNSIDVLTNSVSIIMAILFTVPSLGVFFGIYYIMDELIMGAIIGFGMHFVIFAFSGRISKYLNEVMN